MFSVMLILVVLPMVGFAIDGAILYLIRAKLSAASDASALAGARSLSVGLTIADQTASAQATSQAYFNANFPPGIFGTSSVAFNFAVAQTATKTRTVSIQATVSAPLYFIRFLGHSSSSVSASSQSSRRDVNMMLVLDRSYSMQYAGVCGTMIASAQNFVNRFTNGRDRVGLVTFMGSSNVDYPPKLTFLSDSPSLPSVIGTLQCGGNTGSADALWNAYQQIIAINEPGALNVIVFFTDGVPNGITAAYPIKLLADTRYDSYNTGTLVATPASSCTNTGTLTGYLEEFILNPTGYSLGIYSSQSRSISDTSQPTAAGASGCAFASDNVRMRQDIAYIPTSDIYGNQTVGYMTNSSDFYASGPYLNQLRVDTPPAITHSSTNAADNAAFRIRSDTSYAPLIYCIGLGGTDTFGPVDPVFLNRVANTPQSTSYDFTKPSGIYVYAPTSAQLSSAFETVVSEILRLSK